MRYDIFLPWSQYVSGNSTPTKVTLTFNWPTGSSGGWMACQHWCRALVNSCARRVLQMSLGYGDVCNLSTRHGVHGGPKVVVLEEATQTNRLSLHERRWHRNGSDRHRVGVILAELNLVVATLGAFKKIMRNIQASTGGLVAPTKSETFRGLSKESW